MTTRAKWLWALLALAAVLTVRALELRLPGMTRPFWEDEIHHNEGLVAARTLAEATRHPMFVWMFQPILDFAVRKLVWFPLFGHQELGLRLPSLVYGTLAAPLALILAFEIFRRRGLSPPLALAFAFLVGLWTADHAQLVHDSTEARHYSLVALLSLVFCMLMFLREGRPAWLLALVSALFVNAHFFALPLVGAGYGWITAVHLRRRRWVPAGLAVLALGAVLASTLILNHRQLDLLLHRPPGGLGDHVVPVATTVHTRLAAGWALIGDFQRYLALPLPLWLWWLALAALVVLTRSWSLCPLLAAGLGLVPAFLVYCRVRSSYTFGARYFSPFFGIGVAAVAALLLLLPRAWQRLAAAWPARRQRPVMVAALAAVAVVFGVPGLLLHVTPELSRLQRPPTNFSPYFQIYEELKASGRPFHLLHSHCFCDDIPRFYMEQIGRRPDRPYQIADGLGCETSVARARASLEASLRSAPPGALVVLDQKEKTCPDATDASFGAVHVTRIRANAACVWVIDGAHTLADVRQAADRVGFIRKPGLL